MEHPFKQPRTRGKKARSTPKGRQLDKAAFKALADLLPAPPLRRDHLIEYLHLIQDKFGAITAPYMRALAEHMKLSEAEIFEVASFYAHFDVLKEGDTPPPPLTILVCTSLSCFIAGGKQLYHQLKSSVDGSQVRILEASCVGACPQAPVCVVGKNTAGPISTPSDITALIDDNQLEMPIPDYETYHDYKKSGGYEILKKLSDGELNADEVIEALSDAQLCGLGGAGFPAGRKWGFVRSYEGPRLMTVNGDEGEPGTFKDRHYLRANPHQFLEGTLIAAHCVEAEKLFIYIRDEYPGVIKILKTEIQTLIDQDIIKSDFIEVRRGAGAYICGEESAMISSIEGKRGLPRNRPPYIAEVGLFGRPTLNHNVETLYWIPQILSKGAKWFADQGINGAFGLRSYSVSGRVKKPGVYLMSAGSTANDLIQKAGGMLEAHEFAAYLPGGASGGILPSRLGDVPMDFGTLEKYGCFVGSHALIILSDKDDLKAVCQNLLEFFAHESCGQCTPCRVGCEKAVQLMKDDNWNEELLTELSTTMADASICGLGQAAPNPILSIFKYFPEVLS